MQKVKTLFNELIGALIGLARASQGNGLPEDAQKLMLEGLIIQNDCVSADVERVKELIFNVEAAKSAIVPNCAVCASPCGRNENYDMGKLWDAEEGIKFAKVLILLALQGLAPYAYNAINTGRSDGELNNIFCYGLFAIGSEWDRDELMNFADNISKTFLRYAIYNA